MNLEPHHRRIHWKTLVVRWALAPLALAAGPAWLYFSSATCQEDGDALGTACHALRVVPFLPTLGALALLAFVVRDLIVVGHAHAVERGERPRRRKLKHAARGYRAISERHRRHIHWALAIFSAVTVAVAAWIAWLRYQSTY